MIDRQNELDEFVRMTLELVSYLDYRTEEEERYKYQYLSHINFYWIKRGDDTVGVVKTSLFYFYDLGLISLSDAEIRSIIELIELQMRQAFTGKVQGNIISDYLSITADLGWEEHYSRYRMVLDLSEMKNTLQLDYKHKNTCDYDILKLSSFFIDAYSGGIDERIGMLTKDSIGDSLVDIINDKFGPLRCELSVVAFNRWGKVVGVSMITISEGCPFLVIIGVKKNQQGKGLGRKLLSYNIDKCIEMGYKCMKLWVTKDNPAVYLYESMGFRIDIQISAIYKSRSEFTYT